MKYCEPSWNFINILYKYRCYEKTHIYTRYRQEILKGEVSLYCWPPALLIWNQLYDYRPFLFLFAKQANPNQSKRRSMVKRYFPWHRSQFANGLEVQLGGTQKRSSKMSISTYEIEDLQWWSRFWVANPELSVAAECRCWSRSRRSRPASRETTCRRSWDCSPAGDCLD